MCWPGRPSGLTARPIAAPGLRPRPHVSLDSRTAVAIPASPVAEASIPCSQANGPLLRSRIGVISLYANGRWFRPCDRRSVLPAPGPRCARPCWPGGHGSMTAPPAQRCSRVQRSGPCGRWLDSVGTVARNGMWVRRSVATRNQPGSIRCSRIRVRRGSVRICRTADSGGIRMAPASRSPQHRRKGAEGCWRHLTVATLGQGRRPGMEGRRAAEQDGRPRHPEPAGR
jgi:hypothetical protein